MQSAAGNRIVPGTNRFVHIPEQSFCRWRVEHVAVVRPRRVLWVYGQFMIAVVHRAKSTALKMRYNMYHRIMGVNSEVNPG